MAEVVTAVKGVARRPLIVKLSPNVAAIEPLARAAEQILTRYHLPRLNPLGLNLAAPALFSDGSGRLTAIFGEPAALAASAMKASFGPSTGRV